MPVTNRAITVAKPSSRNEMDNDRLPTQLVVLFGVSPSSTFDTCDDTAMRETSTGARATAKIQRRSLRPKISTDAAAIRCSATSATTPTWAPTSVAANTRRTYEAQVSFLFAPCERRVNQQVGGGAVTVVEQPSGWSEPQRVAWVMSGWGDLNSRPPRHRAPQTSLHWRHNNDHPALLRQRNP